MQITITSTTSRPFETMSKRRRGFPSETQVKRGVRIVHSDKLLDEKLGRNDRCPCGSQKRFRKCCLREGCFDGVRTPHLFGATGTEDDKHMSEPDSVAFIADNSRIVEEKIDGTNVGIHFSGSGEMILQYRRHLITDGMHSQYDLFKQWTATTRQVPVPHVDQWEDHWLWTRFAGDVFSFPG